MPGSRPNIIYIVRCDLGKHPNCYGASEVTSPGLDRLASEGVLFTNYFFQSPAQRAAFCLPQRLWPERTGSPRPAEDLYDISADPNEWDNLAGNLQFAGVKDELAQHLDRWMVESNDLLLGGPIPDRLQPWPAPYPKD